MIKFSVVMAVYYGDTALHVKEATDSLIHQTYPAEEILIVVDGEVGLTIDTLLNELEALPTVEIIRLPKNIGPGAARDFAIRKAKNDVIAIMDADDICDVTRFKKQISILENSKAKLVGSWVQEFHAIPGDFGSIRTVPEKQNDILIYGKWRQPVNHVSIMFTRRAYYSVNGYSKLRNVEDYDFLVRLLIAGIEFYNIPEVLVHVRLGNTINRRSGYKYLRAELKLLIRMYTWHYINIFQLLGNILIRVLMRLLPKNIIRIFYNTILRKKLSLK